MQSTDQGEIAYTPAATGQVSLTVRLLGAGNSEQGSLKLTQEIVPLQTEIEAAIATAKNKTGPGIGNPEVAREIVNDHSPYHQDVTLQHPESDDAFQRFLFGVMYEGAVQLPPPRTPGAARPHRRCAQRRWRRIQRRCRSGEIGFAEFVCPSSR